MLERTVVLEQKLAMWKHNLLTQLQRRPWDTLDPNGVSVSTWDPVFDRLSVILMLRYLNTRIVLHRPILSAFLRQRGRSRLSSESIPRDDPFFNDLGERSVRICQQAAVEIVEIVHKTSKPPALLGAWWFTTYYSKLWLPTPLSVLTRWQSFQCSTRDLQLHAAGTHYLERSIIRPSSQSYQSFSRTS